MTQDIQGGCMCGAVRYSATTNPANSMVCHCQSCRRAAAAPVVPTHVSVQLLRRASSAEPLAARGRVLKAGRALIFAEGEVTQAGELVAKATVTFARV